MHSTYLTAIYVYYFIAYYYVIFMGRRRRAYENLYRCSTEYGLLVPCVKQLLIEFCT